MARVLWVSTETPSREGQGGQRRQFHQIKALRERGHDLTVLVPRSDQDDSSIRTLARVQRPRVHRLRRMSDRLVRRVRDTIASPEWDAVIVSHHEAAWLLPQQVSAPVLIDVHNVMSHWHGTAGRAPEAEEAHAAEARAIASADAVMTCSDLETRRLIALHPEAAGRAFTAPLGVDPAEWPPREFTRAAPRVALFGSWSWRPNQLGLEWFVSQVWPRVLTRVPGAVVEVAGTGVPTTASWPDGADFVGRVPDLAGFTASASVVAVPVLEGVGASVKFAEALASGAAVIATPDGSNAFEAPPALVSDDAERWAEWIAERLERRAEEPAPATARGYALEHLTWAAAAAPIDAWLREQSTGRVAGSISS